MTIGLWELLVLLAVVLLLFGTGKLTRSFGDLAQGVRNFRDGLKDDPPAAPPATTTDAADAATPPSAPIKALPPPAVAAATDKTEAKS